MHRRASGLFVLIVTCALAAAASFAQTKLVGTTNSDKSPEPPPRKLLVLVIAPDPISRASYEDVIAGELSLRGATAVASHISFPELPKERGPFEAKLVAEGFDAITVSRLVGKDDKVKMTEGHESYATQYQGMDYWGGYWYTYQAVFVPGYLEKETSVRVRTDLWRTDGKAGRIVWSGTSETMNPRTAAQAGREVGVAVAKALAKAKLI